MTVRIICGDALDQLRLLSDESVHCCVTSPPYWGLRDYGVAGQLGLEADFRDYIATMVAVFREARRVLRQDGTLWLNLGDSYAPENRGENAKPRSDPSYGRFMQGEHMHADLPIRRDCIAAVKAAGVKRKDLIGMPWRVAFALQEDGWWLRSDIIWSKPNPMPESVTDRPTKAHEYLFLLSRSERYYYDAEAIKEAAEYAEPNSPQSIKSPHGKGYTRRARGLPPRHAQYESSDRSGLDDVGRGFSRNKRSVWTVATQPFNGARLLRDGAGGSGRKVSADCPLHGDRRNLASTPLDGGRQAASRSVRNLDTDSHPALGLFGERVPIETRHGGRSAPDNSGSPAHSCVEPATAHSTESRKTGRALEISPRENGAALLDCRTGDTGPLPEADAKSGRIPANRTEPDYVPDGLQNCREEQTESRSARKCTCEEYSTPTHHFAVFPPALIEPCILAGCPEGGTVLDPFGGAGTTGLVADRLGRNALLIELNPEYCAMATRRIEDDAPLLASVS